MLLLIICALLIFLVWREYEKSRRNENFSGKTGKELCDAICMIERVKRCNRNVECSIEAVQQCIKECNAL